MKYFLFFFNIPLSNIGNVYIADYYNNRIRKVSTGIITTIAGTGSTGYSGDNGAATSATLYEPYGVAVDASGRILYYCPLHRYTVSSAMFDEIFFYLFFNIPVSNIGNVYIADLSNYRIRKVTVSTGIISTIAGTGSTTYNGDNGAATSATLYSPYGVALDASGRIL